MRPENEIERYRLNEPLPKLRARLTAEVAERIEAEAARRVEQAIEWARSQPFPEAPQISNVQVAAR